MSERGTREERLSSPSKARTRGGTLTMAGKVVLITGGTGGIGKATAIGLATLGARIDFDDLQGARNYSGQRAYNQSKLANVMFTNELARRLEGTGVTANSGHPGVVRTNFGAEDQAWFFTVISRVVRPLLKTPAQGARSPIYLASSPDLDNVTGQFFANGKPNTANKLASDPELTVRLWQVSADLVSMRPA